jgi:hypothetical protein
MKVYAGIGSRETPVHIQEIMSRFASYAEGLGFLLRSGGANGADLAFERGVSDPANKHIYLPWHGFNGCVGREYIYEWPDAQTETLAIQMASQVHPNWSACSQGARKLHTRNVAQILGSNLDQPCNVVVCWTPNASGKGGTGQALRLAKELNIPIFDLGVEDYVEQCHRLKIFVEGLAP